MGALFCGGFLRARFVGGETFLKLTGAEKAVRIGVPIRAEDELRWAADSIYQGV